MLKALMDEHADKISESFEKTLFEVFPLQALVQGAKGKHIDLAKVIPLLQHSEYSHFIRNRLIAPNGIVTQVYPYEGNEAVIGLNLYSEINKTHRDAIEASQHQKLIVTGPFNLIQGGQAISGRIAVRIPQKDHTLKNWGLVSISIAFPDVLQDVLANTLEEEGYAYRILEKKENSNDYLEIFSRHFEPGHDTENTFFTLRSIELKLEAYPVNGWISYPLVLAILLGNSLIFLALGCLISYIGQRRNFLEKQASTDSLTGLNNRKSGELQINQLMQSPLFHGGAFLLLDIDHFKQVNDRLGHQIGDNVLIQAAQEFKMLFRHTDIIYRLGGDEFVIFVLFGKHKDFLKKKIAALLQTMEQSVQSAKHPDQTVHISCSIGVAFAPECGKTAEELYAAADIALYQSKNNGRNCVTFFEKKPV